MEKQKWLTTKNLTLLALLTALQIVLGKLVQIPVLTKEYNLGFLPIAVAAVYLGIRGSVIVAALGDVISSLLFPTGAFFPGFTLTAAVVGLVYGLFLSGRIRERNEWCWMLVAVVFSELVNWTLNSVWLDMLYMHKGYWAVLTLRAPSYIFEIPLQFVVVFFSLKGLERLPSKLLQKNR